MTQTVIHEWQMFVTVAGMIGAIIAAVWALVWGMSNKFVSVYRRMDECKAEVEAKFTTKEVFAVVNENLNDKMDRVETDLTEVKLDVKKLLGIANGRGKSGA